MRGTRWRGEQSHRCGASAASSAPRAGTRRAFTVRAALLAPVVLALIGSFTLPAGRVEAQVTFKDVIERESSPGMSDAPAPDDKPFAAPAPAAPAATAAKEKATENPSAPVDDLGRQTPRSAAHNFQAALRARDYDKAAEYLDMKRPPRGHTKDSAPRLARELQVILDRALWIDEGVLSNSPDGLQNDGLPKYRDLIGRVDLGKEKVDVLLERVKRPDGSSIWKLSPATVARIPDMYAKYGYGPLGELLPDLFFEYQLLGIRLWQLVGILVLVVASYLLAWVATWIIALLLRGVRQDTRKALRTFVAGPLRLLLTLIFFSMSYSVLGLGIAAQAVLNAVGYTLLVLALVWVLARLVDVGSQRVARYLAQRSDASAMAMIPTGSRAVKIVIWVVAVLTLLGGYGLDVTALVAGLGVGGIAIALAAQKTIENLIGGVTLAADQPVRVGDFCSFGGVKGTVEEVGLRSTRVRTQDRTVVSIPNADFASLHLDNYSRRDKYWYHPRIGLRYETTPEQTRTVLSEMQHMLEHHEKVEGRTAKVHFIGFGAYALEVEISAYVRAADADDYQAVNQELNLALMEIVAKADTSFAFPSQTMYVEPGSPFASGANAPTPGALWPFGLASAQGHDAPGTAAAEKPGGSSASSAPTEGRAVSGTTTRRE